MRRGRRELPVVLGALFTALFGANDALDLIGWKGLDRWAFFIAFLVFAVLVIVRLLHRDAEIDGLRSPLRVSAKIGSYAGNVPDPGAGKVSVSVHVYWEMWVAGDVSTDRLAMNVIHTYDRRWWQFWKRTRFPQFGLPREGHDTTQYRKSLLESDFQPIKDDAEFNYVADRDDVGEAHWELELVIPTGAPQGEYRVPVFLDLAEMRSRGTNPPL